MSEINTFCLTVLVLASIMTIIHYVVAWVMKIEVIETLHEMEERRQAPLALASPPSDVSVSEWLDNARLVAVQIAREQGYATVDEVWSACPAPEGVERRMMAHVFPRSEWEVVDRKKSERGVNHGRQVAIWQLKSNERVAA